ncbi:MAG: hypothetical protein JWO05_642 [Gemmatimonadetes bacterium]|nr:hypothetical protein [Gemmatimonadota bacterium]
MTKLFASCAAALLLSASVASAQGNGSDITGPSVTQSTIAGGIFAPSAGNVGTTAVPVTPAVSNAIVSTSNSIVATVSGGGTITNPVTGAAIPAAAATVAVSMMSSASPEIKAQVNNALSTSGASATVINTLMSTLPNLLSNPTPGQVAEALSAFNAVVNTANAGFLANPPPEFSAIFSVLSQIAASGNAAAKGR